MNRTSRLKTALSFILLVFTLNTHLVALENPRAPYAEAIKAFEKFVAEKMSEEKVPGLSAGFMKDDFIWTKGFGYADLENMTPAKPESSYRLASVTKTITAMAVLKLVEEGKIDLDAEVQTYIPYFLKKKWPVTVRQLLGHLGGISHYKNNNVEGRIKVHKNTKEAIDIFKDFDLVAEPGTVYNYSSYGFNLLGAVIEGASGKSYGEFIKEHIFDALGMEDSRMDDPVEIIPNRVRGYRIVGGELKNSEYVDVSSRFAAGGTRSTVVDLLKYARGIFDGKILKEETYRMMFTSMVLRDQHLTGYGMGWSVWPLRGYFTVSHGGSQPETRTHIILIPRTRFAVALASNREGLNFAPFYDKLIELVLDEDIDSYAYAQGIAEQAMYEACYQVYSHGMSSYEQNQSQLSPGSRELKEAFAYFNACVNEKALALSPKTAIKSIHDGIHPVSKQAFTRIGAFMASVLENSLGRERLHSYHQDGPLAFFSDYISISKKKPAYKDFRFDSSFGKIISRWEEDWRATYTEYVRRLSITPQADFGAICAVLKKTFEGAQFYPDFTPEFSEAASAYLEKNNSEKAFETLAMGTDLYPNSPLLLSTTAFASFWKGKNEEARSLFKKAYSLNPYHPSVSADRFIMYRNRLATARKMSEALQLAILATELHPRDARLYAETGDGYLFAKQKEKAIEYYKRALAIDPELEKAKERLKELEREGKK